MVLYLTQDEVKQVLDMKSAFEAVENGFREMGNKAIEMPPRVYLHFPKGVLIAMPAYMPNLNAAGTKLVTVHPGNKKDYNLPAVQAKIVINSPENGSATRHHGRHIHHRPTHRRRWGSRNQSTSAGRTQRRSASADSAYRAGAR